MRLRTFNASNIGEAIRLARAELGPEAVILATEKLGKSVRLTAALESPGEIAAPPPARNMAAAANSSVDTISRALSNHGVPARQIDRITAIIAGFSLDDPRQGLNAALRVRFDFRPLTTPFQSRPVLLVGLPGAGKTSCAAKLAAMAKSVDQSVTLVTCDMAKSGAAEQLAIYARALHVHAYRARDAAALGRIVDSVGRESLIVIDSVGSNPFLESERSVLRELAAAASAEPVLVQACGGDPAETAELAQCFAEIGVQRLIGTRLDASRRLGGILSAAADGPLALAEFSHSPEIAAGLQPAEVVSLGDRLLPRAEQRVSPWETGVGATA